MHPPLEAGESLCITCEAYMHALEGAHVPHDCMEMIEIFFFILTVLFGFYTNQWVLVGGLGYETPLGVNWGQW